VIQLLQNKLVKGALFTFIASVMFFGLFSFGIKTAEALSWGDMGSVVEVNWDNTDSITASSFAQSGKIKVINLETVDGTPATPPKYPWWDDSQFSSYLINETDNGLYWDNGTDFTTVGWYVEFKIKITQIEAPAGQQGFEQLYPGFFDWNSSLQLSSSGFNPKEKLFSGQFGNLPLNGKFEVSLVAQQCPYVLASTAAPCVSVSGDSNHITVQLVNSSEPVFTEDFQDTGGATGFGGLIKHLECGPETIFTGCFIQGLYNWIYPASTYLVAISGNLFDFFTSMTISNHVYSSPVLITKGWTIVRDISNVFFIFILLVAAFRTMMGDSDVKKTIKNVIVIALLINFSLFMTKVVIDSSNIIAHLFYNQISSAGGPITQLNNVGENKGISKGISAGLDIQNFISGSEVEKFTDEFSQSPGALATIVIFAIAINVIAAWMFFQVGFLMLGRILGLWMSMIFSPIAFMMYLIPGATVYVKSFSFKKWSTDLVKFAFLAPVFLFFVYIIMLFIGDSSGSTGFLDGLISNTDPSGSEGLILLSLGFFLIIGILKIATDTAKDMAGEIGGMIAGYATKAFGAVAGVAGGVALGGAGSVLRGTVGAAAAKISESKDLKETAAKKGVAGWMARRTLSQADKTSKRDFDVRTGGLGKGIQSSLSKFTGAKIDFNNQAVSAAGFDKSRGKGGHDQLVKDQEKEDLRTAKLLELKGSGADKQDSRHEEYEKDAKERSEYLTSRGYTPEETEKEMADFKEQYEKGGKVKITDTVDKEVKGGSVATSKQASLDNKVDFAKNVLADGQDTAFKAAKDSVSTGTENTRDYVKDKLGITDKEQDARHEEFKKDEVAQRKDLETTPSYLLKERRFVADKDGNMVEHKAGTPDIAKINAAMTKFKADYEKGGELTVAGKKKKVGGGSVATAGEAKTKQESKKNEDAVKAGTKNNLAGDIGVGIATGAVAAAAGAGAVTVGKVATVAAGTTAVPTLMESYGRNKGSQSASKKIQSEAKKGAQPAVANLEELKEILSEAKTAHPGKSDSEAIKAMTNELKKIQDLQKMEYETARLTYIDAKTAHAKKPADPSVVANLATAKREYSTQFSEKMNIEDKLSKFNNYEKEVKKNTDILSGKKPEKEKSGGEQKEDKPKESKPEE